MTSESAPIRRALAGIVLALLLFAAVIVQLTVVNRLPFPGEATPDLVLLLVTAIAVTTAPALAAITGFAGGLALDIAPPAAHYLGEYALIFCLVAYAASRVYRMIVTATGEPNAVTAFTVMVVATAAGEAGKAVLGKLLSDPHVSVAVVKHVLPSAVLYDLLLSPFAFLLVAWIARGTVFWKPRPERALAPKFAREQRLASVFRQASVGAAPSLRLTGTGQPYGAQSQTRLPNLRLTGTGKNYVSQPLDGRVPRLRLAGTGKRYVSRPLDGRVPNLRLAGTGKRYASQPLEGRVPRLRLAGTGKRYVSRPLEGRVPNLRLAGTGKRYVSQPVVGRVPNLRLAGTGKRYVSQPLDGRVPKLRLAGTGKRYVSQPVAGRVPKLRLSDARSSSLSAAAAAFSGSSQFPLAAGRPRKLNFRGDLPVRSPRVVRTPGKNWLRSANSPASVVAKRPARGPARGWLGSGGTGGLNNGRKVARPRKFKSGSLGATRPGTSSIALHMPRTGDEALAARSAPSGLSALAGAGTPLAGRAPQAGWLRSNRNAPTLAKRAPHGGWLGNPRRRPRTVIGSTPGTGRRPLGRPGTTGGNWYTAAPSGAWLRRGRHSWRKRSRRLLRMIGVGQ